MKKSRFNDGSVQNIIKIAFFVLGAVAILQSFPREGRFRYTFQEGKPWRYGLMTAPYDFQIYKNDKQLEEERRLALQDFKPYILLDSSSFKKNLALFKADYHNKYRFTLPSHYYEYLTSWLSNVYASGIIGKKDKDKLLNDSVRFVTIVSNKIAHSQSISTLLTASEAYESLYSSLPSTINPFLLKTCNLNNYLSENLQIDERNTKQARDAML
jgi:cyclic-di-AMP phosphodiesterase PgpH